MKARTVKSTWNRGGETANSANMGILIQKVEA